MPRKMIEMKTLKVNSLQGEAGERLVAIGEKTCTDGSPLILIMFRRPVSKFDKKCRRATSLVSTKREKSEIVTRVPLNKETARALWKLLNYHFKKDAQAPV